MNDLGLQTATIIVKLSVFLLLTLYVVFEFFNFDANLVESLLVLDIFLVQHCVVMLEIIVFFLLER